MSQSISIILEWENAARIGAERARCMLSELHQQLSELRSDAELCEVIFVYDSCEGEEAAKHEVTVAAEGQAQAWAATLRYVRAATGNYYQQKNCGAEAASGDLLLFLDSDVIPCSGWLKALIASFDDPAIAVVGGDVIVETGRLYSKAMSLGWFFTPAQGTKILESPTFFANNVAFRRDAFERFPDTGQYRGQCLALAAALNRSGRTIYINPAARVSHPPPEGLRAFVLRSLRDGHDTALAVRRSGRSPWLRGAASMAKLIVQRSARVWRGRRAVGLNAAGASAAIAIVVAYHALAMTGLVATALAPRVTGKALRRADGQLAARVKVQRSLAPGRMPPAERQ